MAQYGFDSIKAMIPKFNHSGVLPPTLPGGDPTLQAHMSPYPASMSAVVIHFATSTERILILEGMLRYREYLLSTGIENGFQWLDGSFVEDCESTRSRPPKDIDLVTFAERPAGYTADKDWDTFCDKHWEHAFDPDAIKAAYSCDAYYVDLSISAQFLVRRTRYWFGLFSHQRGTNVWKGMIEVPLLSDDDDARKLLKGLISS